MLLHILHYWCSSTFDKENGSLPMVLYYSFRGTNKYSTMLFLYDISYAQLLCPSMCVVTILYGITKVRMLIMVPKKCQYQPNSGPVSKDWPPKYGKCHFYLMQCPCGSPRHNICMTSTDIKKFHATLNSHKGQVFQK